MATRKSMHVATTPGEMMAALRAKTAGQYCDNAIAGYTFRIDMADVHGHKCILVAFEAAADPDNYEDYWTFRDFTVGVVPTALLLSTSPGWDGSAEREMDMNVGNTDIDACLDLYQEVLVGAKQLSITTWAGASINDDLVTTTNLLLDSEKVGIWWWSSSAADSYQIQVERFTIHGPKNDPNENDIIDPDGVLPANPTNVPSAILRVDTAKIGAALEDIAMQRIEISANNGASMFSVVGGTRTEP